MNLDTSKISNYVNAWLDQNGSVQLYNELSSVQLYNLISSVEIEFNIKFKKAADIVKEELKQMQIKVF